MLLALGAMKISAHKPDEAQKIAEEIMALQPEGRVNAEACACSRAKSNWAWEFR